MNIYGVYQVLPLGYLIQQETSLQEHSGGPLNRKRIIYSIQAAATNYYRLGSLNNKHLFLIGLVDQLEYVLLMAVAKVQDASRNTKTLKPWINPGKTVTSGPLPLNKTVAQQD